MTGFPGIMKANGKSPAENLAMLTGKINPDHDFSGVMEEQDLIDLALFVSKGTVDVDIALEKDGTPKGDVAAGKVVFDKICSTCHGPNGNAINFKTPAAVEYLNHPATENPWQFLHRTRIGVTLWPMPSAADNKLSEQDLSNVLAYVRTLDKPALALGGGQLYDKWYTVLGVKTPADNMPLWKTQTTNAAKGASTWTCRECHGLDYLGKDGVYGSGKHMTGFPGLMDSASKSEADLTAALIGKANPDHDFSKLMSEKDIAALVHFIKTEMFAIAPHVKADGITVDGDMGHGKTVFEQTCVGCHGKDGKLLNFKTAEAPEYVGTVAAGEPQVCLHRVTFGVPGFPMSAGLDLGLSVKDVADVCAYAQTLPVK
jgi:thiosulfate dehydrogenase